MIRGFGGRRKGGYKCSLRHSGDPNNRRFEREREDLDLARVCGVSFPFLEKMEEENES